MDTVAPATGTFFSSAILPLIVINVELTPCPAMDAGVQRQIRKKNDKTLIAEFGILENTAGAEP
jgi:hypothetical protein